MLQVQSNIYIVLQVLGQGSYQPVFSDNDGLMCFIDKNSAELEIKDAIDSVDDAIKKKHMSKDSRLTRSDYEIIPATIINPWEDPKKQRMVSWFDGNLYTMLRSEDDWNRRSAVLEDDENEIALVWCVEDVIQRAKERDIMVNEEEAREILRLTKDKHDCTIGVTWDTLDIWTDYFFEEKYPGMDYNIMSKVAMWREGEEFTEPDVMDDLIMELQSLKDERRRKYISDEEMEKLLSQETE